MPDRLELPDDDLLNVNGGVKILNEDKDSVSGHLSIEINGWIIESGKTTSYHCYKCTNIDKGNVYGIKYTKLFFSYMTSKEGLLGKTKDFIPATKPSWI